MSKEKLFRGTRFTFIGEAVCGKNLVTDNAVGEKGWKKKVLNIGVKHNGSTQFLNMDYMYFPGDNQTMMFGEEGSFKVDNDKTSDDDVLKRVWSTFTVDAETNFETKNEYIGLLFKKNNETKKLEELEGDDDATNTAREELQKKIDEYDKQLSEIMLNRKEFGHIKDVIDFMEKAFPIFKGKKIKVTGNVRNNEYNGKNIWKYIPQTIEFVPDDTPTKLEVKADVFYTNDSIEDDIKNKKMFINGWVGERIHREDTLFPQTFVIDYTKIDETNEQHVQLLDFLKDTFAIVDKKKLNKIGVEISVVNGAEKVEFDESCLTDKQKQQIAFGFKKLEDFKPKGEIFGERKQELKVITGDYKEYPDGSIATKINKSDLGEYLQKDKEDISKDDIESLKKDTSEQPKEENIDIQAQMANLFG